MLNDTNAGWPLKPLSEVVDLNPRLDKSVYRDDLEVSFVPMAAVQAGSGRMEVSQTKHFSTVKKGYTPFKERDVLFAKITPCMENGKMGVVPKLTNGLGFGSTEFHVLRPHEGIDPRYVYYFVSSQGFRREAAHRMTGAVGQKRVPQSFLGEALIPVPLFDDQKSIVAEIEKQFSRLDKAVANLKRVKANLKRYKAAVLKAAVEGKLTEDWRKQHPNVEPASKLLERILRTRRSQWRGTGKYKEPASPKIGDSTQLPAVPEGWTFASVEQLLPPMRDSMKTGPFGSLLKKHEHRTSGIAVLGIENIEAMRFVRGSKIYITPEKAEALVGYRVMPHDVLISRSGTVGEVCVVSKDVGEARISTNLMKVSLAQEGMLSDFFVLLFNGSPFVLSQVSDLCKGSTRNFLNQEILRQLCFVLPPLVEQHRIVAEVERCLSIIEELDAAVEANLTRADRLRQSILSQAFNGRLVKICLSTATQ